MFGLRPHVFTPVWLLDGLDELASPIADRGLWDSLRAAGGGGGRFGGLPSPKLALARMCACPGEIGIRAPRQESREQARGPRYRASHALFERLAKADPGNAGWQHDLSVSHNNVGDVQRAQGDLAAALRLAERGARPDDAERSGVRRHAGSQLIAGEGEHLMSFRSVMASPRPRHVRLPSLLHFRFSGAELPAGRA